MENLFHSQAGMKSGGLNIPLKTFMVNWKKKKPFRTGVSHLYVINITIVENVNVTIQLSFSCHSTVFALVLAATFHCATATERCHWLDQVIYSTISFYFFSFAISICNRLSLTLLPEKPVKIRFKVTFRHLPKIPRCVRFQIKLYARQIISFNIIKFSFFTNP